MNEPEDFIGGEATTPDAEAWERSLSAAMRPVEPPGGFALRVMERAAAEEARFGNGLRRTQTRERFAWLQVRWWTASAVTAVLALGVFVGEGVHRERERGRAEATRQFEAATRITDQALERTREQLQQAGILGAE